MQRLDLGSVLLFGGSKDGKFLLDTVIVIAKATPRSVHATHQIGDPTLRRVTCDSVATVPNIAAEFTLCEGATATSSIDGMFSFTPCRPHVDGGLGIAKRSPDPPSRSRCGAGRHNGMPFCCGRIDLV